MICFTELQRGRISELIRQERAISFAQVPGKAQRQILMETSVRPVFSIASQIVA